MTITVGAVGTTANVGVISSAPASIAIGTPFPFTLNVSNAGPAAATNVVVTDTLPEGTTFVSATTTAGSCDHANGTMTCNLGTLASSGSVSIVLTVRPTVGGSHRNTASISTAQADPVVDNNTAVTTVSTGEAPVAPCTTVCFSGPTNFTAGPAHNAFTLQHADFNGDGNPDVVFAQAGASSISVLLGDGNGGFGAPTLLTTPGIPESVATADFNGDNRVDIVVTAAGLPQLWLFFGNAAGGFGAAQTITLAANQFGLATGDFNRDGQPDIVLAGDGTGALVTLLLGSESYQTPHSFGTTTAQSNVVVDDFNNDGDSDVAARTLDGIVVMLGNGTGGFGTPIPYALPGAIRVRKVGDLNGDGFKDLVVGYQPSAGANDLVFLAGNGAGGFAAPVALNSNGAAGFATSADFDSDGDLDLVWVNLRGGFAVQANNGLGVFAPPIFFAGPVSASLAVTDLDRDGRLDVTAAVGQPQPSQVLVYLNTCDQLPADLALTIEAPAAPVIEGGIFTYSIQVTNNGPTVATGLRVEHNFGANLEFVSFDGQAGLCNLVGNRLSCTHLTLASGATLSYTAQVRAIAGGIARSQAGVTATTSDPNPGNNAAFVETTVTPGAGIFEVTNTNDSGPGSLRQALTSANLDAGPPDTIRFNIPGPGPHTIRPTMLPDLPQITQPVVIDGTTQPGYTNSPLIEISGENADFVNGFVVTSGNTVIRGLAINRFPRAGIFVPPGTGGGNVFEANFIGTNISGTAALANVQGGIVLQTANNRVGGTTPQARNIISGNGANGVFIAGAGATGNVVSGNFIGTNLTGTAAVPNAAYGVGIAQGAAGNTVGGIQESARNIISGNLGAGVGLFGVATDAGGNTVLGNFIGLDLNGSLGLPNSLSGVFIQTSNNNVGSVAAGGNWILFNGQSGVRVESGTGNGIVNNRIASNGGLGIDLGPLGVTQNDANDADTGPNNLLNFPVLTSARTVGNEGRVQVNLTPPPSGGPFQVHFYANTGCDPLLNGEGSTPIGVSSFGASQDPTLNFEGTFSSSLAPPGSYITATTTDSGNNTSEFSQCAQVDASAGIADLAITKTDSPDPVTVGEVLTYQIGVTNNGPDAASLVTVTDVLPAGVSLVSANATIGSCSGTTTVTCELGSIANGANIVVSIVVRPTTAGSLTNTATVSATGTDPVSANNSATATTTVTPAVPATYVVTNSLDNGAGSLRQAILDANAHTGPDSITFAIAGSGVRSIVPATALPTITSPVTIDGNSQTGFNGTPLIELNGAQAGSASGLVLNTSNTLIRGLIINRFANGNGIFVQASATNTNNRIEGNWIGLDSTGNGAAANNFGIRVESPGNTVGGATAAARNVVSGNTGSGITVQRTTASGNTVQGNYVGTNVTGNAAVPNQGIQSGIFILDAPNTTIGGTSAGSGNVISGNAQHALTLVNTSGNVILGNLIGTEPNGVTPLGNGGIGLDIVTSSSNTVGGAGNARNTVSNNGTGMQIRTGANDNVVTNTTFAANGLAIRIDDASRNRIGSINAADGNVIQNNQTGIIVLTATALSNSILSNSITGNTFLGIDIDSDGITPNDAGDADSGPNGRQNFPVLAAASGGVQGTLNSTPNRNYLIQFFGNAACDSSGNGEGATLLGSSSVATDANGNATIPLFAVAGGQFVTATATDPLENTSEFSSCVQVLAAEVALTSNDSPDPVLVGDQLSYSVTVTNNGPSTATNVRISALWNAPFTVNATGQSQGTCEAGVVLLCSLGSLASGGTATVTIVGTPTSVGVLTKTVTVQADESDPVPGNNSAAVNTNVIAGVPGFVVFNTLDSGDGSLRQAILNANARFGGDTITFAIPGSGVHSIAPATALPAITDPVILDATTQPGYVGTPLIELNGTAVPANGLNLNTGDSVIRGFTINRFGNGITVQGTNNRIEANWLGLNAAGTATSPNGNGIIVNSSGNTIGGVTAAARNVISGNTIAGVQIAAPAARANVVTGNYIGTDPAGVLDLGNLQAGVIIIGEANVIGGLTPAERNIISGNNQTGVRLALGANANIIQGNFIGTDVSGTLPLANGEGVSIGVIGASTASSNTIGGPAASAGNRIAFNSNLGVSVTSGSTNNAILGNSITGNGGIGIDLNADGVTANDPTDTDEGANDVQNFPVLTAATGGVTGSLNSIPNGTFRIEFFGNTACDASGNGEGATFLGTTTVSTDGVGNATIPLFTTGAGQFVTATATDSSNNTSEFSACVLSLAGARTWVSNASGNWETASNWSGGVVPQSGEHVIIDRPGVSIAVTVSTASVNLASLQSQETLVITGGAIGAEGAVGLLGGLTMSGGSLTNAGELTLGGTSLWTGGSIGGGPGPMTVQTGAALAVSSPGVPGILARNLSNNGVLSWNQPQLSLASGAQIVNQLGGLFEVQGNLEIVNTTSLDPLLLTNHGVMVKSGAIGTLTLIGVRFSTTGTLQLRLGAGPVNDQISSTESGALAGVLSVALEGGFVPTPGTQFEVVSVAERTGTFALINGGAQSYIVDLHRYRAHAVRSGHGLSQSGGRHHRLTRSGHGRRHADLLGDGNKPWTGCGSRRDVDRRVGRQYDARLGHVEPGRRVLRWQFDRVLCVRNDTQWCNRHGNHYRDADRRGRRGEQCTGPRFDQRRVPRQQPGDGLDNRQRRGCHFCRHDNGRCRQSASRIAARGNAGRQREQRDVEHHLLQHPWRRASHDHSGDVPADDHRSGDHRRYDAATVERQHAAYRHRRHGRRQDVQWILHRRQRVRLDDPWPGDQPLRHHSGFLRPRGRRGDRDCRWRQQRHREQRHRPRCDRFTGWLRKQVERRLGGKQHEQQNRGRRTGGSQLPVGEWYRRHADRRRDDRHRRGGQLYRAQPGGR